MTSVLVVDDDRALRRSVARALAADGYEVVTAPSADDALALLERRGVDVLLTDLRMGSRDGIDLLEQVRRSHRTTRSILMSAYATARDHQAALAMGAVRVLCKPFTTEELLDSIRQAVDCETGYRGTFHGLSLLDLLQMFHQSRRSISIYIDDVVRGAVHIDSGEHVHAVPGASRGREALRALLERSAGSIRTAALVPCERSIREPFQLIVLDLLREIDEGAGRPAPGRREEEDAPRADRRTRAPSEERSEGDPRRPGVRAYIFDDAGEVARSHPKLGAALVSMIDGAEQYADGWSAIEALASRFGVMLWQAAGGVVGVASEFKGRYAVQRFRGNCTRHESRLRGLSRERGGEHGKSG